MSYLNFNGKIVADDEPILLASNRGYRYGDGLFETMKVLKGNIMLSGFHFERLFAGLALLKYEVPSLFTPSKLKEEVAELCQKNKLENLARVRLSVYRGNGGINDEDKTLRYIIESWPLSQSVEQLNENGLILDVFPDARKSCDLFANLKSANFLPYSMAAIYAKEHKYNDCLILNTHGNIADSTIANLFIIKGDEMKTPALQEGCVNGVMRRYLLDKFSDAGLSVQEAVISIKELQTADEVFLTNAIYGIRWVKRFESYTYTNTRIMDIFNRFIRTIHA